MAQLTLVAHYGAKPPALARLLTEVGEGIAASAIGLHFQPYPLDQIHATIIGLERTTDPHAFHNANHLAATGERRTMDFAHVLALARRFPSLTIRLGGFAPQDTRIDSFGATPYVRTLQIHLATRKLVLMGWHHANEDFACYTDLWRYRRRFAEECGVRPKYWHDSDFFLTMGELTDLPEVETPAHTAFEQAATAVAGELRKRLAEKALDVPVRVDDLALVRYTCPTLNQRTSRARKVTDMTLTAADLRGWYGAA